jgi:hypothetical protein
MRIGTRIGAAAFMLAAAVLLTPPAQAEQIGVCGVPSSSAPPPVGNRISATPDRWATTNGYVQTGFLISTAQGNALVIGGRFSVITEPDGRQVLANNLAVVAVDSGRVIYAGDVNSNVRSVHAQWGLLYIAGKFTAVSGKPRNYIAQINTQTWQVTDWNPGASAPINAVTALHNDGVIYAGSSTVRRRNIFNAAAIWSKPVTLGPVRSLMNSLDGSFLLVGGLFETYNGYTKHGLVAVNPSTGVEDRAFGADLRPDSGGPGSGQFDGDAVLDLAWSWSPASGLMLHPGIGSAVFNTVRGWAPYATQQLWYAATEGDTQAVTSIGGTVVAGWHRGHGNGYGCPFSYFGNQFDARTGTILTYWDPRLSGSQPSDNGEQNGGIHDLTVDGHARKLFVLGAFTQHGAACDVSPGGYTGSCPGGSPLQSIAVYSIN